MNVLDVNSSANSAQEAAVGFNLNILILGLIAANYGNYAVNVRRPMDGWGNGWESFSIRWEGCIYTAGSARMKGVAGIRIACREDGDKKLKWDKFVPWSSLDSVQVHLEAVDYE